CAGDLPASMLDWAAAGEAVTTTASPPSPARIPATRATIAVPHPLVRIVRATVPPLLGRKRKPPASSQVFPARSAKPLPLRPVSAKLQQLESRRPDAGDVSGHCAGQT